MGTIRLGYAATEPGTQSDNQTGSLILATPATTGRGLYVALTRGQQENLVYVVTDTNDIAEARDVLEAIMSSDRADTPAITQRRLLAQQHHQPPQPPPHSRCQIPDWFHQFREFAITELDDARDALERSRHERQPLHQAVQQAEQRIAIAREDGAPFEQTVSDTQQAVALAKWSLGHRPTHHSRRAGDVCRNARRTQPARTRPLRRSTRRRC